MKIIKSNRGHIVFLYCQICNKKFRLSLYKINHGMGKYCSKQCYGAAVKGSKRPFIGEKISKTKHAKGKYVNFICEVCKKQTLLSPSHAEGRRTCSRECMGILVSHRLKKMWENPPDSLIEKIRTATIKRRKNGRINKETKPEKMFREELERKNIVFEQQFGFGGMMIADFYIPSLQAFIFVDGSYWHNLPSSQEKDWQQMQYAKAKGMKAYRFTDKQIFKNVSKCVDLVLEDAEQPLSFGDLIDRFTILGIKTQLANGDKLKQIIKDYRRMNKLLLAGIEHYKYSSPEEIIRLIKDLLDTNIYIFNLVEKIKNNKHTREDAKKAQDLNQHRSELLNALNKEFRQKENNIRV
ncbi:DUF559 domain-containing protein [Candidatus Roizmanbacteria bacterium]|nr:DUF559 domain-containing protein [Candidatus Roizmanbacteria bacterium]